MKKNGDTPVVRLPRADRPIDAQGFIAEACADGATSIVVVMINRDKGQEVDIRIFGDVPLRKDLCWAGHVLSATSLLED